MFPKCLRNVSFKNVSYKTIAIMYFTKMYPKCILHKCIQNVSFKNAPNVSFKNVSKKYLTKMHKKVSYSSKDFHLYKVEWFFNHMWWYLRKRKVEWKFSVSQLQVADKSFSWSRSYLGQFQSGNDRWLSVALSSASPLALSVVPAELSSEKREKTESKSWASHILSWEEKIFPSFGNAKV